MRKKPRNTPKTGAEHASIQSNRNRIFSVLGPTIGLAALLAVSNLDTSDSTENTPKRSVQTAQSSSTSKAELTAEKQYKLEQERNQKHKGKRIEDAPHFPVEYPVKLSQGDLNKFKQISKDMFDLWEETERNNKALCDLAGFLQVSSENSYIRSEEYQEVAELAQMGKHDLALELAHRNRTKRYHRTQVEEMTEIHDFQMSDLREAHLYINNGDFKKFREWFQGQHDNFSENGFGWSNLPDMATRSISENLPEDKKAQFLKRAQEISQMERGEEKKEAYRDYFQKLLDANSQLNSGFSE